MNTQLGARPFRPVLNPGMPRPRTIGTYRYIQPDVLASIVRKVRIHLSGKAVLNKIKWQKQLYDLTPPGKRAPLFEPGLTRERVHFALSPTDTYNLIFLFSGPGFTEYQMLPHLPGIPTSITFVDKSEHELAPAVIASLDQLGIPFHEVGLRQFNPDLVDDHTIIIAFNPQLDNGTAADRMILYEILEKTKIIAVHQATQEVRFAATYEDIFQV